MRKKPYNHSLCQKKKSFGTFKRKRQARIWRQQVEIVLSINLVVKGLLDGWMDEWGMDGQVSGWMDGSMDGAEESFIWHQETQQRKGTFEPDPEG